jgi:hypothetical protein
MTRRLPCREAFFVKPHQRSTRSPHLRRQSTAGGHKVQDFGTSGAPSRRGLLLAQPPFVRPALLAPRKTEELWPRTASIRSRAVASSFPR